MDKKFLSGFIVIILIISINIPCLNVEAEANLVADVLIYAGAGAWGDGVTAFEYFLDWKGMSWLECDDTYIENNDLVEKFGAIHFPGGDSGQYNADINTVGMQNIREFVDSGGGYIGICAGGYFACDRIIWEGNPFDNPLDLFNGVGYGAIDEIIPWPGYTMTTINMNLSNPINQYEPSTEYIMYYGGAAFYPDPGQEMNIIGTYDLFNDDAAIINFNYGNGRVLLFGPHPEIEEDSARDGVTFADDLEDLGTDWNLLWTCMDWIMGWPISEPPDNLSPEIPEISGTTSGEVGIEYEYTFVTIDPESEEISFYIEWGDGQTEEWIGPYGSGEEVILEHSWSDNGTYTIRAKAKDCNDFESDWGTLEIEMPTNIPVIKSLFLRLFERFPNILPILRHLLGL